ncbi:MAG: hypothetical protein DRQ78_06365 [Epsilonproteobacteria bacterium]|nr:MAG: hypothetical protein DRQ78_06365 [Campylobacterota bacterium]
MNLVLLKFFKSFFTTIIIFYSKKLIYYIDDLFEVSFNVNDITCENCGAEFKSHILNQTNTEECFFCGTRLDLYTYKENESYESRKGHKYRGR